MKILFRKKLIWVIALVILSFSKSFTQPYSKENDSVRAERLKWYKDAKFGMFIHWGAYSVLDGKYKGMKQTGPLGEWIMRNLRISIDDYKKDVVGNFNPVNFDAESWIKEAHDAGIKYLVMTTKHHDGFAMFNSKVSDYNIFDATPFKRDIFGEIAEACQKYQIKLGIYYSQAQDWYHPGGFKPDQQWDNKQKGSYQSYFNTIVKGQITELLTQYGDIDIIWWDSARAVVDTDVADKVGKELVMIQPNIIVNPRLSQTSVGDFSTFEQVIPAILEDEYNELCLTHNRSWSYKPSDDDWKSPEFILTTLTHMTAIGGNFLFNVGPKPNGEFPIQTLETLSYIGDWMKINGESIYGTEAGPFYKLPFGEASIKAQNDKSIIYFFVYDWPKDGTLTLPGIKSNIEKVEILGSNEVPKINKNNSDYVISGLPVIAPHDAVSVIKLEVNDDLIVEPGYVKPTQGLSIELKPSKALFTIKPQFDCIPKVVIESNEEIITNWKKKYDNDRNSNTGNKAHWKVELEKGGNYEVLVEYATKEEGNIISMKGGNYLKRELQNTGGINNFKILNLGELHLIDGVNTITLTGGKKNDYWSEVAFKTIKLVKL